MKTKQAMSMYNKILEKDYVKHFYQSNNLFSKFENLTEEAIAETQNFLNLWINSPTFTQSISLREKYIKTIFYLNRMILAPFDEKVYFLINAIDPDLQILATYKQSKESKELKKNLYEQFGFISRSLLIYENVYYNKFLRDENPILKKNKKETVS